MGREHHWYLLQPDATGDRHRGISNCSVLTAGCNDNGSNFSDILMSRSLVMQSIDHAIDSLRRHPANKTHAKICVSYNLFSCYCKLISRPDRRSRAVRFSPVISHHEPPKPPC